VARLYQLWWDQKDEEEGVPLEHRIQRGQKGAYTKKSVLDEQEEILVGSVEKEAYPA